MSSNIMIIESGAIVVKMAQIALTGLPFEIEAPAAEEELLAAMTRLKPSLILMGSQWDGFAEALEQYEGTGTSRPMIIALGSEGDEKLIAARIELPFETHELVRTVYEVLGLERPDELFLKPQADALPLANVSDDSVPPTEVREEDILESEPEVFVEPEPEIIVEPEPEIVVETQPEPDGQAESVDLPKGTISLPVDDLDILEESILEEAEMLASEELEEQIVEIEQVVQSQISEVELPAGAQGLTGEVEALTRRVIEDVVWEVVPRLAEALLKEEIAKVVRERFAPGVHPKD